MTTNTYEVILEGSLNGCACMSTRDVFEASSADDAERQAIEAWRAVEPALTFRPLVTVQQ